MAKAVKPMVKMPRMSPPKMPNLAEQGKVSGLPAPKCHLPSGASQSPKGDLGALSARELRAAFPRQIKRSGGSLSNPLSYRKPSVANDYGNGASAT